MSPLWLLVFLTWYHLSAGSETDDISTSKNTIVLQPSDASQQRLTYDLSMDNYARDSSKPEHLLTASDNDEEDVMIYRIIFGDGSPYVKYLYPPTMNDNNNREKRSTNKQPQHNKHKRYAENDLQEVDANHNKQLLRSNIYNLLLQAKNLDSFKNGHFASHFQNPESNMEGTEKRSAKFHAWGGKRNDDLINTPPPSTYVDVDPAVFYENMKSTYDMNKSKRARFSSWGGKREEVERTGPKTLPFRSWGGKRENPDVLVWPKHTPFKAWGGKRSESVGFYPHSDQALNNLLKKNNRNRRPRFHSWGGKRNDIQTSSSLPTPRLKVDNPLIIGQSDEDNTDGFRFKDNAEKRARFNAWGGKRTPEIADLRLGQIGDYTPYKKSFHSWGGKRTSNEPEDSDYNISLTSFDV